MAQTTTAPGADQARATGHRRWWVLAACVVASVARATEPPVSVFWPPQVQAFNAGWADYSFWTSVVSLGALSFLLIGGVLGDIFGRRRLMLIGLGGLLAGNLLVLFATTPLWFMLSRLLAGAFGTLVVPLSLSMIYLAFTEDGQARARAIAIYVLFTSTAGISSGLLGQLMFQLFDWRASFAVPLLLSLAGLILVVRETSESRAPRERHVDVVGHAAWALTVFCAMFSLVVGFSDRPYAGLVLIGTLSGVVVGVALLVWWDRRSSDTIFGRSKIKRRALSVLIVYGLCMQFGSVALIGQVRNVLQAVYDYGVVLASVALAPLALGMLFTILYAGRRFNEVEPRSMMALSLLLAGGCIAAISLTRAASFYPLLALLLFCFGATWVLSSTTWTLVFFIAVPNDAVGVRTGINSSVSQLGSSLGTAVAAGLLVQYGLASYERLLLAAGVPPERVGEALEALNRVLDPATPGAPVDPAIGERLLAGYQISYLAAYDRVLLISAGIAVAAALLAWVALPHTRRAEAPEAYVQEAS